MLESRDVGGVEISQCESRKMWALKNAMTRDNDVTNRRVADCFPKVESAIDGVRVIVSYVHPFSCPFCSISSIETGAPLVDRCVSR